MANKETFKYISNFLNRDGISGYESDIAAAYKAEVKKSGAIIERDGFGSVIAKIGTKGPKIMLAAHMDEVGFVVQQIEKEGMLRISPVGGHWVHTILAMKVKVINTKGKEFIGVVGSTSVHVLQPEVRTKVMKMMDVYVDLGLGSVEEVKKAGIDVGDQVVRMSTAELLADGDKYMAKAVDNRIGVAIIAKIVERLKGVKHDNVIYAVATAQEEVGLRGGKASTQHIQPDIAIAIDTTVSHDTPGIIKGDTKLGHGVAVTMKDNSAIANPTLANMLFDLSKKHKIPAYKYVSAGGGNDSGVTQYSKGGIPVVSIAIPTRYLHTPFEIGSIKDFDATVDLLVEFIKMFNNTEYKKTLYK
ncbi:M42 family metallopeptidase [Candidatus Mycoplasma mahonii]|uniref:M42 family metallopeptidase n=1 Tax=Candidatus Mycoplasma mahonii TaxID=3004105 RepID=UPI0026F2A3A8|nr:M42 family metallopeptidase [Candidatus Mycoplasma mahonii]WKX02614.1 M42 family metallopeptidase [Candidatus Mycoplasma mahonii]